MKTLKCSMFMDVLISDFEQNRKSELLDYICVPIKTFRLRVYGTGTHMYKIFAAHERKSVWIESHPYHLKSACLPHEYLIKIDLSIQCFPLI